MQNAIPDPTLLPSVPFLTPRALPQCTAVYFCLSADATVLYVGSSWNIRKRWYQQEKQPLLAYMGCASIAWKVCTLEELPALETVCIQHFRPLLNEVPRHQAPPRSPMIPCQCRICGQDFALPQAVLGHGHVGRYCSATCYFQRGEARFITQICLYCQGEFATEKWKFKHGAGKYCSLRCSARGVGKLLTARNTQRMWQRILTCAHLPYCLYCCWWWQGSHDKDGYPKHANKRLHRTIWEWHNQRGLPVDDRTIVIRHLCAHPGCVNPWHLAIGTHKQNTDDARRAGNLPHGIRHYRAKFTDADIRSIRQLQQGNTSVHEVAALFSCSISTVRHIWKKRTWIHVS
jgi:hypothetical protein